MLIAKFGNQNKADIVSFCKKLPQDLATFLEKYNGGETPETFFSTGSVGSDIVAFYGVGNVKYSYDNVSIINIDNTAFLPIAFDSFGNHIVISLNDGTICFLDHEKEQEPVVIAENLKKFLNCVKSKPIDPKHIKPISQREKELTERGKADNISDELRKLWQAEIDKYTNLKQEPVEI